MDEAPANDDGLPPIAPDGVGPDSSVPVDEVVPSRGTGLLPTIGLGGSAGGIPALQAFFRKMPPDSGMAFVVVLHLSPDYDSCLAEIIQRSTTMPVAEVRRRTPVLANHVYVISPGQVLTSVDDHLDVTDSPTDRVRHAAVDLFFRTLADSHGAHSAAIVLSGADGDGAIGIKRIKECGGLTIAQDPAEAEHGGMPRAAIGTGMVDWVLNVDEMPARLLDYQSLENRLKIPPEDGPLPDSIDVATADETETALRDVLAHLRVRTGRDFSYYKRATIVRRIARRMQVNGIREMAGYLVFLRMHPGEAGALLQDLLISVTNFFRDRDSFVALEARIPALFQGKGVNDTVRVWVPACATGEEAYSIAILLFEHARTLEVPPVIQVFATDLDDDAIRTARDAMFPDAIAADVSEERLRRFFVKEHRGYRVRREIREVVLFAVHDVLKDSPFSRLDLISCRNLLIYLNRDAQKRTFETFHFALRSGGHLFLGTSETAEDATPLFAVVDKKNRIFVQRAAPRTYLPIPSEPGTLARAFEGRHASIEGPVISLAALNERAVPPWNGAPPERRESLSDLHYKLLERLGPPSVIVDSEFEVLHSSPGVGKYMQYVGGEPTRDLLRLVLPMMRVELRALLYRAAQTGEPAEVHDVDVEIDGKKRSVTIRVTPAGNATDEAAADTYLVVFEAESEAATASDEPSALAPRQIAAPDSVTRHIESELERIKARLRETVEQSEASTEELKASNEELQAMNEELRSATEELETSREELQSINEELTTVNFELKGKVDELGTANGDLHNLMASTAIATIFLDRDLRIGRYTPAAVDLFNLIPSDVGRPLSDLTHRLQYAQLTHDARHVLETLIPVEREVGDTAGNWFLARLLPYRTIEDRIAGVVLTFIDISELKQAEAALRVSEDELRRANAALDERVQERTRKLRESESDLMNAAATSDRRAKQLQELTKELTQAERRERRRLAQILHDHVQQLLVAARMRIDVLRSDAQGIDAQVQLNHVGTLINDTIQVARTLSVELAPPMLYEQGLPAALEWLAGLLKTQHRLRVEVIADADADPAADEDRDLLFQATRELLLNVVKHAKIDRAAVRLQRSDGSIVLEVSDRGTGFTVNASSPDNVSFGLFHLRERVEWVGGSLAIDSAPGQGARVTISIPARAMQSRDATSAMDDMPMEIGPAATSGTGRLRVVIVDDHEIVREGLAQLLKSKFDIDVVGQAGDGRTGVELACRLRPDVVLMDVSMPGMNGLEAVKSLLQSMPDAKVIGLSLHDDEQTAQAMLDAGAKRYLTKGGGAQELLEAIRQVVTVA